MDRGLEEPTLRRPRIARISHARISVRDQTRLLYNRWRRPLARHRTRCWTICRFYARRVKLKTYIADLWTLRRTISRIIFCVPKLNFCCTLRMKAYIPLSFGIFSTIYSFITYARYRIHFNFNALIVKSSVNFFRPVSINIRADGFNNRCIFQRNIFILHCVCTCELEPWKNFIISNSAREGEKEKNI